MGIMKSNREGGEIVQVEGGHIIRSTDRKDRHSKVYTAKGPRDRRVRLSAHTAIQFYDVQDRLGYDRPSKAVDWLINKAKSAIDKLDELPPWNPMDVTAAAMAPPNQGGGSSSGPTLEHQHQSQSDHPPHYPPPSTFQLPNNPMESTRSEINFQNYTTTSDHHLCLSLHSNLHHDLNSTHAPQQTSGLFFDPRNMVGWDNGEIKTGFFFTAPHSQMLPQNAAFSQREPLQSSFSSHFGRAWNDQSLAASDDNNNEEAVHHFSLSNAQYSSGFQVPARIHGEDPNPAATNTHH